MSKRTDGYERGLRGVEPKSSPGFFQSQEEWEGQQEGYKEYLSQKRREEQEEKQREERNKQQEREKERKESKKHQEKCKAKNHLQIIEPVAQGIKDVIEQEINEGIEIRTESKTYDNGEERWAVSDCYLFFDSRGRFRDRLIHVVYNSSQDCFYFQVFVHKYGFRGRRPENGWHGGILFQEYKGCEVADSYIKGLVRYVLDYRRGQKENINERNRQGDKTGNLTKSSAPEDKAKPSNELREVLNKLENFCPCAGCYYDNSESNKEIKIFPVTPDGQISASVSFNETSARVFVGLIKNQGTSSITTITSFDKKYQKHTEDYRFLKGYISAIIMNHKKDGKKK